MLGAGAEVDGQDGYSETPLRVTAGTGNATVAKALPGAGAEVEARDALGHTPLHATAMKDDREELAEESILESQASSEPETLSTLLAAGASLDARDETGQGHLSTFGG